MGSVIGVAWRLLAGGRIQGFKYPAEICCEGGQLVGGCGVQDLHVDWPVAVHYPVAQRVSLQVRGRDAVGERRARSAAAIVSASSGRHAA